MSNLSHGVDVECSQEQEHRAASPTQDVIPAEELLLLAQEHLESAIHGNEAVYETMAETLGGDVASFVVEHQVKSSTIQTVYVPSDGLGGSPGLGREQLLKGKYSASDFLMMSTELNTGTTAPCQIFQSCERSAGVLSTTARSWPTTTNQLVDEAQTDFLGFDCPACLAWYSPVTLLSTPRAKTPFCRFSLSRFVAHLCSTVVHDAAESALLWGIAEVLWDLVPYCRPTSTERGGGGNNEGIGSTAGVDLDKAFTFRDLCMAADALMEGYGSCHADRQQALEAPFRLDVVNAADVLRRSLLHHRGSKRNVASNMPPPPSSNSGILGNGGLQPGEVPQSGAGETRQTLRRITLGDASLASRELAQLLAAASTYCRPQARTTHGLLLQEILLVGSVPVPTSYVVSCVTVHEGSPYRPCPARRECTDDGNQGPKNKTMLLGVLTLDSSSGSIRIVLSTAGGEAMPWQDNSNNTTTSTHGIRQEESIGALPKNSSTDRHATVHGQRYLFSVPFGDVTGVGSAGAGHGSTGGSVVLHLRSHRYCSFVVHSALDTRRSLAQGRPGRSCAGVAGRGDGPGGKQDDVPSMTCGVAARDTLLEVLSHLSTATVAH